MTKPEAQYLTATTTNLIRMGYPCSVAQTMVELSKGRPNSAYNGNFDEEAVQESAEMAARQIIQEWYKITREEYLAGSYPHAVKWGHDYLVAFHQ